MGVKNIIKGHINELTNNEQELYKARISICKNCPLYKNSTAGPVCNSSLYLNVETGIAYLSPEEGRTRGCGCRLNAKTRDPESVCPANKW